MTNANKGNRLVMLVTALAVVGFSPAPAHAGNRIRIKQSLVATGVDVDARGDVKVKIDHPKTGMRARLNLTAKRLAPSTTYEVVLDGVRVGTLTTNRRGNGRARFSSQPRGKDQLLGTDPRGMQVEMRNDAGDGVLETHMPDDTIDPTHVRCCLPHSGDDSEAPECEDRTPEACVAAGGVDLGAGSCLPNPCEAATPPPPVEHVVCCTPDDPEPECEVRSAATCSEHHGVNLGTGTCDPNPCAGSTPSSPETVRCCLPDDHGTECEHRTPELCATQGGTSIGAGICDANACGTTPPPAGGTTRCCLPHGGGGLEPAECENRTAEQCAAQGGTDIGAGSCDPNPCG
jgi:hypothetical protein